MAGKWYVLEKSDGNPIIQAASLDVVRFERDNNVSEGVGIYVYDCEFDPNEPDQLLSVDFESKTFVE